jgi:hypothetical protein
MLASGARKTILFAHNKNLQMTRADRIEMLWGSNRIAYVVLLSVLHGATLFAIAVIV